MGILNNSPSGGSNFKFYDENPAVMQSHMRLAVYFKQLSNNIFTVLYGNHTNFTRTHTRMRTLSASYSLPFHILHVQVQCRPAYDGATAIHANQLLPHSRAKAPVVLNWFKVGFRLAVGLQ